MVLMTSSFCAPLRVAAALVLSLVSFSFRRCFVCCSYVDVFCLCFKIHTELATNSYRKFKTPKCLHFVCVENRVKMCTSKCARRTINIYMQHIYNVFICMQVCMPAHISMCARASIKNRQCDYYIHTTMSRSQHYQNIIYDLLCFFFFFFFYLYIAALLR